MRNYSKDNISRFINGTRKVSTSFPYYLSSSFRLKYLKFRYICLALALSTLSYLCYRKYKYEMDRKKHYIDLFEWKQQISKTLPRHDLWNKIKKFNFSESNQVVNVYCSKLSSQSDKLINDIHNTKTSEQLKEDNNKRKGKKSKKNNTKELLLSKTRKSTVNFGFLFKINTKQYSTSITNNGNYVKKVNTIPFMIFNVPYFGKMKQEVKKIGRRDKYSKIIENKQKFQLSSQCESINYWNIFFIKKNKQQQYNDINKTLEDNQNNQLISNQSPKMDQKRYHQNNLKKQLLFQCKSRVIIVEQELKQKLKKAIDETWKNKLNLEEKQKNVDFHHNSQNKQ